MSDLPEPTLRLTVDKDALASNWHALDQLSGSASAGAAVKADCYGLGVDASILALRDAGARDFFVAHWSEVPAVAAHVPPEQISVLHGPASQSEVAFARQSGARPVINSLPQARRWIESGGGLCDVMIDTGINRLGLSPNEVSDPLIAQLDIDIVMSHVACADEDSWMNAGQLARFNDVTKAVQGKRTSLANSAGIALGSEFAFDVTRPGLSLYGGVPREELAGHIQQVARLEAALIQIRQIEAGDSVGYNARFTAPRAMKVGVVSLGYADGLLRCWEGNAALRCGGNEASILGKVSMDMVVIDLASLPDAKEGDWLELPYHLPNAAQQSGLSQYELLTILGSRFRR